MSQRDMASSLRAIKALEYRKQGYQWVDIARLCGYADKATAYNAVNRAIQSVKREDAEELRELQMQRLDDALRAVHRLALGSTETDSDTGAVINIKPDLWALDRYLRIIELQSKLCGLYPDGPVEPSAVQVLIREYGVSLDNL